VHWFFSFIYLYSAIVLRYFLVAGLFHYWTQKKNVGIKLHSEKTHPSQIQNEIRYSLLTSLVFAVAGVWVLDLWQNGKTAIYLDWNRYGYFYLPISLAIYLFIHDTYFYWLHRWMHQPKIFHRVHRVHHASSHPTAWAAFSFHPYEAFLQAVFFVVLLCIVPIHLSVLGFFLVLMTVTSVLNHLGVEVYPASKTLYQHWITATHHDLHHRLGRHQYALYFTWWDKWMGTEATQFSQEKSKILNT